MNIAHWIERANARAPEAPALACGEQVVADYAQLAKRVARLAGGLRGRLGLARGERVAIIMANSPTYIECLFAIWHAGLVAVPVNAKLHESEFRYVLAHSGAAACFVGAAVAGLIDTVRPEEMGHVIVADSREYEALAAHEGCEIAYSDGADPAWLFYTSGTTGRPKGAVLTHRNLTAAALNYFADFDRIGPGDAIIHAAPLSHGSGLWMLPHVVGGALNIIPESGGFAEAELADLINHWPSVSMFAAPTMVRRLTVHCGDINEHHLKLISYGGAPMYVADAIAALDRFGPRLAQLYGQGECPMTITHLPRAVMAMRDHPRWRERLATAGVADSCVHVRIVDGEDRFVPTGESGEIVCRGEPVMAGYWRDEEATAKALAGGWLHTGDIGHLDSEGFLTLTDRAKDLIISGGANIYPREIEEVLLAHPAVAEAAVIGAPDREWGERVIAYVVAEPGGDVTPAALDTLCLAHIARFKRPRAYRFVAALPKNNYGKVLKSELRLREQDEETDR